jgi:excisionase family DNA binding protein
MGDDEILTIIELSKYLKISKPSLYYLVQKGHIPGAKVGRHWRFSKKSIDRWIAEKEKFNVQGKERRKDYFKK